MQIDISNIISNIGYESVAFSTEETTIVIPDDAKLLIRKWCIQHLLVLGAKANPKVAYLAYHAKTQRARIKNRRRLLKIGCLIEIRGD